MAPRLRDGVELTLVERNDEYGAPTLVNRAHETFLFLTEYVYLELT